MSDAEARPPAALEYGRRPRGIRWRRWIAACLIVASVVAAAWLTWPQVELSLARRAGAAEVARWYQAARTCVIPDGTLLYTAHVADIDPDARGMFFRRGRSVADGPLTYYVLRAGMFPLLRTPALDVRRVPVLQDTETIYAHEHPVFDDETGLRKVLLTLKFLGREADERVYFHCDLYGYDMSEPLLGVSFGGQPISNNAPGRSLENLRIYAGRPDPKDPARFSMPFDSDGGRGRFEFKTDTDPGQLPRRATPEFRIEWDDAATLPATRPAAG